jgi:Flp pilus assembly protein TadG
MMPLGPSILPQLAKDRRGVTALEFALVAPIMIALLFGMTEIVSGLAAKRRVAHTASTIADVVSQVQRINKAEVEDTLTASTIIMSPLPTGTDLKLRVSSVVVDDKGQNPTVAWSVAKNDTKRAPGNPPTLPTGVVRASEGVIVAEVTYTFRSLTEHFMPGIREMKEVYYLRPRRSAVVTCEDCK